MREDFSKILVERPRGGSRVRRSTLDRERAARFRDDEGALPAFESSSRKRGGTKHLSENFGPLLRFLRSRVGRPWNTVYSELSQHVSLDNAVQRHTLQHLESFVSLHVEVRNGHVYERHTLPWRPDVPLWNPGDRRFYVCPRTGILRRVPARPLARPVHGSFRRLGPMLVALHCEGRWHIARLVLFRDHQGSAYDVILQRAVLPHYSNDRHDLLKLYRRADAFAPALEPVDHGTARALGLEATQRVR